MKRLFFYCALLIAPTATNLFGAPDVVRLQTGDAKTLHLEGVRHFYVSKKGLINLTRDRGDFWTIVALKAGIVTIQVFQNDGRTKSFLVDVAPRHPRTNAHWSKSNSSQDREPDPCTSKQNGSLFEIRATIELADDSLKENSGFEHEVKVTAEPETFGLSLRSQGSPEVHSHQRQIIANPLVISKPCSDVSIRTGGEDAVESKTEEGRTITTWKSHGLDLKLKLIPIDHRTMQLPFSISLRTPSKGQGNYGLTDVHARVETILSEKFLAAAINLSSTTAFEQNHVWLAGTPLIGPLFRRRDDSKAASKMLVWFQVSQKSVDNSNP